ncbi:unnamed protein product [Musa hybrid cultivar]
MGAETSISSATSRHPRWSASDWLHIRRTGGCNGLARPLMSRALDEGDHDALVDPEVGDDHDYKEMGRMIASAAACTPHSASLTPRMSQQVVRALEGGVSVDEVSEGGGRPGQSGQYGYMTETRRLANTLTSQDDGGGR